MHHDVKNVQPETPAHVRTVVCIGRAWNGVIWPFSSIFPCSLFGVKQREEGEVIGAHTGYTPSCESVRGSYESWRRGASISEGLPKCSERYPRRLYYFAFTFHHHLCWFEAQLQRDFFFCDHSQIGSCRTSTERPWRELSDEPLPASNNIVQPFK